MSIRAKAIVLVVAVSVFFVAATWLVQRTIMLPEFARLERHAADENLKRCLEAINRDLQFLARSAKDYAAWDDTYQYAGKPSRGYEQNNLLAETFQNLNVDLIAILRSDGSRIWGAALSEEGTLESADDVIEAIASSGRSVVAQGTPGSMSHGLIATPAGVMLVGFSTITSTDRTAPGRGSLVMARLVDGELVEELSGRTAVALALRPLDALPTGDVTALAHLGGPDVSWHDSSDRERLKSYTLLEDLSDRPILLLSAELPRVVTARARDAAILAGLTSIGAGVLMSLITWLALARMIVEPLIRVTRHAVRVGAEGDLRSRLALDGKDEIATLARELDQMVARLADSQSQLVELAHGAGRAEIATNVLHNVGNVLNSANVAVGVIARTLEGTESHSLEKAAHLLARHQDDLEDFLVRDERGRHLPDFLVELSAALTSENDTLLREVKALASAIEHIRQVVAAQNEYSSARPLTEPIDPATLVDQALVLTADSLQRHHIRLERRLSPCGVFPLDRHRVLQILANLLANAAHAVKAAEPGERRIAIGVERVNTPDGEQLRFSVADSGVGIPPENLDRIFGFGFSTRPGGHGIGLHSAVNLAREMGGDLAVASEGPGRGAAFTLTLPQRAATGSA